MITCILKDFGQFRKKLYLQLFILVVIGSISGNASAGTLLPTLWGWQGSVTYIEVAGPGLLGFKHQHGATKSQCDSRQIDDIQELLTAGHTIHTVNPCTGNIVDPTDLSLAWEKYLILKERIPIPGPVCLSCPLLSKDFVSQIYPERHQDVFNLMDRYQIFEYNQQLQQLQQQFDLEGFEAEMYHLETIQRLEKSIDAYR